MLIGGNKMHPGAEIILKLRYHNSIVMSQIKIVKLEQWAIQQWESEFVGQYHSVTVWKSDIRKWNNRTVQQWDSVIRGQYDSVSVSYCVSVTL